MKISIIIPVYNTGNYLASCFNSILSQTFKDFEVIIVNDGSSDNSLEICKRYQLEHSNFFVINKENTGVSDSRNIGIRKASGKYVFFCDSDDILKPDCLSELVYYAENYNADLVTAGFEQFNSTSGQVIRESVFPEKKILNREDALDTLNCIGSPCDYIFPKLFLRQKLLDNNVFFREDLFFMEDTYFTIKYISYSEKIYVLNEILYRYREHEHSVTARSANNLRTCINIKKSLAQIKAISTCYIDSMFDNRVNLLLLQNAIEEYILSYCFEKFKRNDLLQKKNEIKFKYRKCLKTEMPFKTKIKYWMILFCPFLLRVIIIFHR